MALWTVLAAETTYVRKRARVAVILEVSPKGVSLAKLLRMIWQIASTAGEGP